jgi:hypothetical protein
MSVNARLSSEEERDILNYLIKWFWLGCIK